jgi:hypothetical protein
VDKLKVILKHLQKQHFWLLSIVCIVAGLTGWMMASKRLAEAYARGKSEIEGAFSGLDTINNEPNYPNGRWKEELGKLTHEERQKVKAAWELVYNEQKQLLKWPGDVLGEDFVKTVEALPNGGEIPPPLRERYGQLIQQELPKLLVTVSTEEKSADKSKPGEAAPKIVWEGHAQLQKGLDWKSQAPRSADVWLAQEDLWIYAAVLQILDKVNTGKYVLPISRIEKLSIGEAAAADLQKGMQPGHIDRVGKAEAAVEAIDAGGGPAPVAPAGEEEGGKPADEGRYVGADGKPLPGGTAAKEQFKRMPVFMRLKMDQRELPKLLVECANSPLPLEVMQLRINPTTAAAPGGARPSSATSKDASGQKDVETYEVPIEISGVIYMYNKPDLSKLGGDAAAAGAAPAPAATPGG